MAGDTTPRWIGDLLRFLPIRSQFVVAGNIRDSFLTPLAGTATLAPLLRCLWAHLSALDYRLLLVYDPIDGLRPYPNEPAVIELATRLFDLKLADGAMPGNETASTTCTGTSPASSRRVTESLSPRASSVCMSFGNSAHHRSSASTSWRLRSSESASPLARTTLKLIDAAFGSTRRRTK